MYKVNVWEVKVCPLLRGISYCVLHSWCPVSEVLLWYKGKGNVHMVLSETTVSMYGYHMMGPYDSVNAVDTGCVLHTSSSFSSLFFSLSNLSASSLFSLSNLSALSQSLIEFSAPNQTEQKATLYSTCMYFNSAIYSI